MLAQASPEDSAPNRSCLPWRGGPGGMDLRAAARRAERQRKARLALGRANAKSDGAPPQLSSCRVTYGSLAPRAPPSNPAGLHMGAALAQKLSRMAAPAMCRCVTLTFVNGRELSAGLALRVIGCRRGCVKHGGGAGALEHLRAAAV